MQNNLLFGGVDLGVAVPLFRLIDLQVGGVERNPSALDPPASDGQIFGSLKNGIREIVMVFCLPDEDMLPRAQAIQRLNTILSSKKPKELRAQQMGEGYYNAICTEMPSLSRLGWTDELTATFTAYDPNFYSDFDDLDAGLTAGAETSFFINCSGSVCPIIRQTVAATLTDPTWTCSNGQTVMLQGSVAAGALVIDCIKRDVTLDAVSILAQVSLDSLFFEFAPCPEESLDPYTITCSNGAAGTMTGKYRWL